MTAILIWFGLFLIVFTAFALQQSVRFSKPQSAAEFAVGDGALPGFVYAPTATAFAFSAIAILILPALVHRYGITAASLALAAVAIPVTGALFLPRVQAIGKARMVTDFGALLAAHHGARLRPLWALIAALFAIPFIAVQLRAAGHVINLQTDGVVPLAAAVTGFALIPLAVALVGGLRGAAAAAVASFFLLLLALIVTSVLAFAVIGSLDAYAAGSAALAEKSETGSGLVVLAWLVALFALQASPAFLTLALGSRSARGFPVQQVSLSAILFGLVLLIALPAVFVAAHMLGLDTSFAQSHPELARPLLGEWPVSPEVQDAGGLASIAIVIRRVVLIAPWVVSFLGFCIIASMAMAAAAEASAAGATLVQAIVRDAKALVARIGAALMLVLAIALALTPVSIFALAGFALGAALQILPALLAVAFLPRIGGAALISGQAAGIVTLAAATLSIAVGDPAMSVLPGLLALAANLFIVFLVTAVTGNTARTTERRALLDVAAAQHRWTGRNAIGLLGIIAVLALAAFGDPIADALFGQPDDRSTWTMGVPPMLPWLTLLWLAGAVLMGMLPQKAR